MAAAQTISDLDQMTPNLTHFPPPLKFKGLVTLLNYVQDYVSRHIFWASQLAANF